MPSAQVYCQFPNLGDAKVGLVDLPGLGEIGNSASEVHLKGLEDKVDQILLVMKPSKEKAFADAEVGCMFAFLLDRLGTLLPEMDRQKVARCMGAANLDGRIAAVAAQIVRSMDRVLRSVPSSDRVMKQRIDAEAIHDNVAARIADGLFRTDAAEWIELTSSSRDYYNLYLDECKRIRYEIIDAYCGLDRFYGAYVADI